MLVHVLHENMFNVLCEGQGACSFSLLPYEDCKCSQNIGIVLAMPNILHYILPDACAWILLYAQ